jgi:hypothetical protein
MILSVKGEPFKQRGRAEAAIKDMPDYVVVEKDDGFVGIVKGTGPRDVVCPGCGQSHHETTDSYDLETNANPSMLTLKEPWKSWGWDDLGKDPSAGYGCLVCPDCGTALAPSGTLTIRA